MAVARLSGAWILSILKSGHPGGVVRRVLLDEFASLLVTPRSSRGAKGRLAGRLYRTLDRLVRQGKVGLEDGIVRLAPQQGVKPARPAVPPEPSPMLRKALFRAMMAEDRPEGGMDRLKVLRWDFLAQAIGEGWEIVQAASCLGVREAEARRILNTPPGADARRALEA